MTTTTAAREQLAPDRAGRGVRGRGPGQVAHRRLAGNAGAAGAVELGGPARMLANLPSVLERGYRGSNVARPWSGSGLGLAGAHEIVAAHGGTISLECQLGSGTTVTVRLPLGGLTR
jgi:hypothetical protein